MHVNVNAVYATENVSRLPTEPESHKPRSSIPYLGMAIPTKILGGILPIQFLWFEFLLALIISLTLLQLVIGHSPTYVTIVGLLGLGIEATLPIPQFLSNYRHKSVAGFRPSVIISWLLGDIFKCSYFFLGNANVTWQFKACAIIQISFDLGIAVQFFVYGNNQSWMTTNGIGSDTGKQIEEELEEGVFPARG